MPSYAAVDIEQIALDVKRILLNTTKGINQQITDINIYKSITDNADYGKYITLALINETTGIYFLTPDFSVITQNPWLGIIISQQNSDELGGKVVNVTVKITVNDPSDGTVNTRAVRYLQALENVFERNRFLSGLKYSRMVKLNPIIELKDQAGRSWREVSVVLELFYPMW